MSFLPHFNRKTNGLPLAQFSKDLCAIGSLFANKHFVAMWATVLSRLKCLQPNQASTKRAVYSFTAVAVFLPISFLAGINQIPATMSTN